MWFKSLLVWFLLKTRLEGIGDVFDLLAVGRKIYDDNIEPTFFPYVMARDECPGSSNQKSLFAGRHHLPGQNPIVAASGLYFGNHQKPFIFGYDIDFFVFEPPVFFQNAKPLTFKMPR